MSLVSGLNNYGANVTGLARNLTIPGITTPILLGGQPVHGGGLRGFMARNIQKVDKDAEDFENVRYTLREAWNTSYPQQLRASNLKMAQTPFRAVNNSGDLLSRQSYSCGGPSQVFQSRPGLFGLKNHMGAIYSKCDGTNVPPASCNVKYVYDSSNYTTFLKQQATNRNYNDLSYGGDDHNSSQVALKAIRRF
jgi:hypothetical protein